MTKGPSKVKFKIIRIDHDDRDMDNYISLKENLLTEAFEEISNAQGRVINISESPISVSHTSYGTGGDRDYSYRERETVITVYYEVPISLGPRVSGL